MNQAAFAAALNAAIHTGRVEGATVELESLAGWLTAHPDATPKQVALAVENRLEAARGDLQQLRAQVERMRAAAVKRKQEEARKPRLILPASVVPVEALRRAGG